MQFKHIIFFAIFLIVGSVSCTEIGPTINLVTNNDPDDVQRVVVVEEFTGVRCVNCPAASDKLQDIITQRGEDKVIAIAIHAGIFATPYSESNEDFRTGDGTNLLNYLGQPSGYPSAVINRVHYDPQQPRAVDPNDWNGYIGQELQKTVKVKLDMTKDYDATTRELKGSAELLFLESVSGNVNITFVITENDVEDVQLTPDGKVNDYKHKHILRDIISTNSGDLIGENIAANFTTTINFNYNLPAKFKAENCEIIAFVNRNDGGTLDILQGAKAHVID